MVDADRRGDRGVDGAAGGVGDGARLARRVRRHGDQRPVGLGRVLPRLPLGLGDWRRPFSLRNLDLLFLLSPTASLWYFNHGDVFTAVPLFYPCLAWVVLRGTGSGRRNRGTPGAPRWPVWVLLAATIFLAGFRVGLNVERSNVIDVGYSGVIGAERIVHGQAPWGNFPERAHVKSCGTADCVGRDPRDADPDERHAASARTREGDTYGPVAYEAYIPG